MNVAVGASTSLGGANWRTTVAVIGSPGFVIDSVKVGDALFDENGNKFSVTAKNVVVTGYSVSLDLANLDGTARPLTGRAALMRPSPNLSLNLMPQNGNNYITENAESKLLVDNFLRIDSLLHNFSLDTSYFQGDTLYLIFPGGDTVSTVISTIEYLNDLNDVDTSGIEVGDILQWDGVNWTVVNGPGYVISDTSVQQLVYAPAHGLTDTIAVYGYVPVKADFTRANSVSVDSAFIAYAIDAPHPDSLLLMFSGFLNYLSWHGKEINTQYYLQDDSSEDTTPGTISIPTAIASDSLTLFLREVGADIAGRLRRIAMPSPLITAFGGNPASPTDAVVQAAIEGTYLPAGLAQPGTVFTLSYATQSYNPTYQQTAPNTNPLTPSYAWLWDGAYATRIVNIPTSVNLQDVSYGVLGTLVLLPIDSLMAASVPTDTEVALWLDTNYTTNNLRLANGSLLYFVGDSTRQNPEYIWQVIDDISFDAGDTDWEKILKRIKFPVPVDTDLAANGLTMSGDSTILGGALNRNTTIAGGNYGLTVSANNDLVTALTVQNNSTSGNAVSATATNGVGVSGSSTANSGGFFQSVSGYAGSFSINPTSTTTMADVLSLTRRTTGTAGVGIGAGISFTSEYNTGSTTTIGNLGMRFSDVTSAGRSSLFEVNLVDSLLTKRRLSLSAKGQLTLDGYANNALNNADSALYVMAVDATGDVHTRAASGLGGDGNGIYDGSGSLSGNTVINMGNNSLKFTATEGGMIEMYGDDSELYLIGQGTGGAFNSGVDIIGGATPYVSIYDGGNGRLNLDQSGEAYLQAGAGARILLRDSVVVNGGSPETWNYVLAYSNPSTTSADTSFMVWVGNGSTAQPGFIEMASVVDGNGIYSGSGVIPDSTYGRLGNYLTDPAANYGYALGFFPSFPDRAYGSKEKGLYYSPDYYDELSMVWSDTTTRIRSDITLYNSGAYLQSQDTDASGSPYGYVVIEPLETSLRHVNSTSRTQVKVVDNRITIGSLVGSSPNDYFNIYASDTLNNGYVEVYEKYRLPNATPSTTLNDTTVMAWRGTGSAAEPIGFINKNTFGSPASSALSIYNLLPSQNVTIDPNTYDLQIGTAAANNTGEFEFYALTAESQDVTIYAGSRDSSSVTAGEGFFYDAFLSSFGAEDGIMGINYEYFGTVWNAATFADSILFAPYPSSKLTMVINGLPDNPTNPYKLVVQDTVSDRVYLTDVGDLPINELVSDSLANDSIIFDLETRYQKIFTTDMTSASASVTVLLTNPITGGVYTLDFSDITGTQTIVWPSTMKDQNRVSLGTIDYSGPFTLTMFYDGTNYIVLPPPEPYIDFQEDSITTTTLTLDLEYQSQKMFDIDMASATSVTLTINNPASPGSYLFHFIGVSGTDNVTWPANFYDSNGTALGTDALTAGVIYTCYYNPSRAKFYCK